MTKIEIKPGLIKQMSKFQKHFSSNPVATKVVREKKV